MMMSIEYINILINKDNLQWTHLYDYKVENKQFFWKEQLRIYLSRSNNVQVAVYQQQLTTKKKFNSRIFCSLNCHVICCNSSDYFTLL